MRMSEVLPPTGGWRLRAWKGLMWCLVRLGRKRDLVVIEAEPRADSHTFRVPAGQVKMAKWN